jgi:hypothetical protein
VKTKVIGAPGLKFKSWSQTRLSDYDECPLKAKLKHLDKLCPLCFEGTVKGGYDTPAICDTCGGEIVKGEALVRGTAVGGVLEHYVKGAGRTLPAAEYSFAGVDKTVKITHPKVLALAKTLRAGHAKAKVAAERMFNFDRDWKLLPPRWSPNVWLIVKMDIFQHVTAKTGRVIDWKTGGCEKKGPNAGRPYENEKYEEQLQIYSTGALCAFPLMESMSSALCFVDAGAKFDPIVEKKAGYIAREALDKNKAALEKRVFPIFNDTTFSPKANPKCTYCDFQKGRGGPCPY